MAFLKFDKAELVNLEYSLSREALRSNRAGSYASTTISGCNTRKYHGLLVCPLDEMEGEKHVLLSSLDVTLIQHEKDFNLGIHKYEGDNYVPRGHKYIRDYNAEKGSTTTYRVGGMVLKRETMLVQEKQQILIKLTLEEATSPTLIQLRPFLAFRNIHKLSKANLYLNRHYTSVPNGIKSRMYDGYPDLYMQVSKASEFVPVPDWYYNIEYLEEQRRGYEYKEDLYVPGYFEMPIKKGESIIFSASTEEIKTGGLKKNFQAEAEKRTPLDSFYNCLINSAQQFLDRKGKETWVLAGFPWHGSRGRETFIALPGLTMVPGDTEAALDVIETMVSKMKDGLFPNTIRGAHALYNSIDAPLWFIWSLQELESYTSLDIWKKYKKPLLEIMQAYMQGGDFGIRMMDNGLISADEDSIPLTWMDSMVEGKAITLRKGFAVEVNALWYNAVKQIIEWSGPSSAFSKKWKDLPEKIRQSFVETFYLADKKYLADVQTNGHTDSSVRPNQLIAGSLRYSPLSLEMKKEMLDVVKSELLTSRGLRTLSPKNPAYKGVYEGDPVQRDSSAHQGSVHPWFLEHFAKSYLEVHKRSGIKLIKELFDAFEEDLTKYGIGTIAEIYDGNPPHHARGAISFATSVASLLRTGEMIEKFNK
jgi:predicted glycogen debranching enzyme